MTTIHHYFQISLVCWQFRHSLCGGLVSICIRLWLIHIAAVLHVLSLLCGNCWLWVFICPAKVLHRRNFVSSWHVLRVLGLVNIRIVTLYYAVIPMLIFCRNWTHTDMLNEFCTKLDLCASARHSRNEIDYTYNFAMKRFNSLHHFIMSSVLFDSAVGPRWFKGSAWCWQFIWSWSYFYWSQSI